MRFRNNTIFLLFLFFVSSEISKASHIAGGELNYTYLGNNNYQVNLSLYRDCYNGQAPFDNPAAIGIFDSHGNLIRVEHPYLNANSIHNVPNAVNSPCLDPPDYICYEVADYVFTTSLPPAEGGYTIAYQRCCRNFSVVNVANIERTGATYVATIPDSVNAVNSNPVFNTLPPTFICKDVPFTIDHSATDSDGDSLAYFLSYPFEGGTVNDPTPDPPSPPPYSAVSYLYPYSLNNLLGGVPMQINSQSGRLTATPDQDGQYIYGVTVKEYRNGIFIGETRRDFQINVVPCPNITVASIFSPTISCGSLRADFTNTSYNAATYNWNFGNIFSTNDTSTLKNPSYLYPDTGTYLATLIAYSARTPLCNDTARGVVHIYPVFIADFNHTNNRCSAEFQFNDRSHAIGGIPSSWKWDFGDSTSAESSNPLHIYSSPGEYTVTLIASTDSACEDTLSKTISVLQNPLAQFSVSFDTCQQSVEVLSNSLFASSTRFDYGDNEMEYDSPGFHVYHAAGNYDLVLTVVSDSLCTDTELVQIRVPALPVANFQYQVAECDSDVQFLNLSSGASAFEWNFGDNETSGQSAPDHIYSLSGYVPVSLLAKSAEGCESTFKNDIYFVSYKKAYFSTSLDSCKGEVNFYDLTNNAAAYYWDFGDSTVSIKPVPSHKYSANGNYRVSLIVNSETTCSDSVSEYVNYELPLGEKIFIPNTFTPNNDGVNDNFFVSLFRPCETYSLEIYNRWGQEIFRTDDPASVSWDGTYNSEQVPADIYVFVLKGETTTHNGMINLVR